MVADINNPALWYTLNESGAPYANTGSGGSTYNLTVDSGTTQVTGILGNARNFDGIDDYLESPLSHPWFDGTHKVYSLSLWIYPKRDNSAKFETIFSIRRSNAVAGFTLRHISANGNPGTIRFQAETGSPDILLNTSGWPVNAWSFCVVTLDGNYVRIYRDAVEVGNLDISSYSNVVSLGAPLTIGVFGGTLILDYFKGIIDDIRLWDNEYLTQNDINALYEEGIGLIKVKYDNSTFGDPLNIQVKVDGEVFT